MRSFLWLLLMVLGACSNCGAIIGIGYTSKDVLFWRFWEIKDGKPVPEILVFNNRDSAVSFTIRKVFVEDRMIDSARRKRYEEESARYAQDTVIKTVTIPPHQSGVFVLRNGAHDGWYDGAYIDGKFSGIAGHELRKPDVPSSGQYEFKYYSWEGMYATPCFGMICTNKLFVQRGEKENFVLLFDFRDSNKDRWQSFKGINDISAKIIAGLDEVAIGFGGYAYGIDSRNKVVRFPANIRKDKAYKMDISCSIAQSSDFPLLDVTTFIENGSHGFALPIFVQ